MLSSYLHPSPQAIRRPSSSDQPVPQLLETTTSALREQFEAEFVWTCLRMPGEASVPLSSAGRLPVDFPDSPIVWEGDRPRFHAELAAEVVAHGTVNFQAAVFDIVLGRPGRPFSPAEGSRFEALRKRAQRALDRASILQCEQALRYQESLLRRREAALRRMQAELFSRERVLRELTHDLINDLTPLTYAAEELADLGDATDSMRLILLIDRQCVRMRHRLRAGLTPAFPHLAPITELIDWRVVLADLAQSWRSAFERKVQSFCLLLPERTVIVRAAERDLFSIASNLLSNAQKYTSSGGRIEVRLQHLGDAAVLEIGDTGRGMHPAFMERLCQPGAREHTDVEGSGIGLYQIRQLIESLGGTLAFESELGIGTTCRVRLPIAMG